MTTQQRPKEIIEELANDKVNIGNHSSSILGDKTNTFHSTCPKFQQTRAQIFESKSLTNALFANVVA